MFTSPDRKQSASDGKGALFAQIGCWNATDGSLATFDDSTNKTKQFSRTSNVTYIVTTIRASFYRALLYIARTMPSHDVSPSICLSVRLSVTRHYSSETAKHISKRFSQRVATSLYQTIRQLSDGDPSNRGVECSGV